MLPHDVVFPLHMIVDREISRAESCTNKMESMNSFEGFSRLGSDVTDLVVRFCPSPDQRLLLRLSKYLRASVLRVLSKARELTGDSARLVLSKRGSADNVVHLDLEGDEYPMQYLSH
eukprot:558640_1